MCLAPYNLTEAAISAQELASGAMEQLFDKKEELPEGQYIDMCDIIKTAYEKCDTLAHPEKFRIPFCEWPKEDQYECREYVQETSSKIAWLINHLKKHPNE